MSHFTRIKTKLHDLEVVRQALMDIGHQVEGGLVRGYHGRQTEADLVVKMSNQYDVGFRKEGDEIVLVGDFYGVKLNRTEFINQVSQRYAYLTIMNRAETEGWQVVGEDVQQDGSIKLIIQQWD